MLTIIHKSKSIKSEEGYHLHVCTGYWVCVVSMLIFILTTKRAVSNLSYNRTAHRKPRGVERIQTSFEVCVFSV